ncbi:hypothetical protein PR048_024606 [Dryococelus australis]|uniref:Uncharacterized protein n=1 Tax=Dryococelus australis TaxID=614101 RepID=A0ABQ9GP42_9NEOP|nr:hypothetical protein PR048_024606 [Dryococelus australis]
MPSLWNFSFNCDSSAQRLLHYFPGAVSVGISARGLRQCGGGSGSIASWTFLIDNSKAPSGDLLQGLCWPKCAPTTSAHVVPGLPNLAAHNYVTSPILRYGFCAVQEYNPQSVELWSAYYVAKLHEGFRGGVVVRILASLLSEPGSIPGGVAPGFLYEGIVPDDNPNRSIFSGISRFPRPCIPALIRTHLVSHLVSPLSAVTTSIGRALKSTQSSPFLISHACTWGRPHADGETCRRPCVFSASRDILQHEGASATSLRPWPGWELRPSVLSGDHVGRRGCLCNKIPCLVTHSSGSTAAVAKTEDSASNIHAIAITIGASAQLLLANPLRLLGRKIMQEDIHRGKEGFGSHGLHFGAMTTSLSAGEASRCHGDEQAEGKWPAMFRRRQPTTRRVLGMQWSCEQQWLIRSRRSKVSALRHWTCLGKVGNVVTTKPQKYFQISQELTDGMAPPSRRSHQHTDNKHATASDAARSHAYKVDLAMYRPPDPPCVSPQGDRLFSTALPLRDCATDAVRQYRLDAATLRYTSTRVSDLTLAVNLLATETFRKANILNSHSGGLEFDPWLDHPRFLNHCRRMLLHTGHGRLLLPALRRLKPFKTLKFFSIRQLQLEGWDVTKTSVPLLFSTRYDGNTARLAHRSDEALEVRVSVARIAPLLLNLGRGVPTAVHPTLLIGFVWSAHRPPISAICDRSPADLHMDDEADVAECISSSSCGSHYFIFGGATVAERLACPPPTKPNRVQCPVGSLRMFACGNRAGRCRWSAGFFRGSPVSPTHSFRRCSILISTTLIGSQDLDVKNHPNLFTHFYFFQGQEAKERYERHEHARLAPYCSYAQGVQCFRSDAVLRKSDRSSLALSGDDTLTAHGNVALIAPALLSLKRGKMLKVGGGFKGKTVACAFEGLGPEIMSFVTLIHLYLGGGGITVLVRLLASQLGEPGSIPGGVAPRIFACAHRHRAGRCRCSAGFLGDLPFPPPLHSGDAQHPPRFTLIGSQDSDVESRPTNFRFVCRSSFYFIFAGQSQPTVRPCVALQCRTGEEPQAGQKSFLQLHQRTSTMSGSWCNCLLTTLFMVGSLPDELLYPKEKRIRVRQTYVETNQYTKDHNETKEEEENKRSMIRKGAVVMDDFHE